MSYSTEEYLNELALIGAQVGLMGRRLEVVKTRLPDHIRQQIGHAGMTPSALAQFAEKLLDISDSSRETTRATLSTA